MKPSRDIYVLPKMLLALSLLALNGTAASIYSNLGNPSGALGLGPLYGEFGDQVSAAGTDRFVTGLNIEIYSQGGFFPAGNPGVADFTARLYANDGPAGIPGSLLWQSDPVHVAYPGGLSLLAFSVPQVLVPDVFTWTLQYTNMSTPPPALPFANTPTIGSSADFSWFKTFYPPVGWTKAGPGQGFVENLMASVQAVPEPSVAVMLLIIALPLALTLRNGKWKQATSQALSLAGRR